MCFSPPELYAHSLVLLSLLQFIAQSLHLLLFCGFFFDVLLLIFLSFTSKLLKLGGID